MSGLRESNIISYKIPITTAAILNSGLERSRPFRGYDYSGHCNGMNMIVSNSFDRSGSNGFCKYVRIRPPWTCTSYAMAHQDPSFPTGLAQTETEPGLMKNFALMPPYRVAI